MAFDILKIHGNSNINYVMCSTLELSDSDMSVLSECGLNAPDWGADTLLLANFHDDTDASSYTVSDDIVGYKIQRYEVDYDRLYEVTTIGTEDLSFYDYNLRNNKNYEYRIIPIYSKDGVEFFGRPISTDSVYTNWRGWSIVGTKPTREANKYVVDDSNIWAFEFNVSADPIRPIFNKSYLTGFGQYPKVVQGQENYLEGSVSCLIGSVSCNDEYINDDIDAIEKWRAFCNNGELKLLKDRKGHVIPCSIKDTTPTINYNTLEQITAISFSFVQLMDRTDISVYGLEV